MDFSIAVFDRDKRSEKKPSTPRIWPVSWLFLFFLTGINAASGNTGNPETTLPLSQTNSSNQSSAQTASCAIPQAGAPPCEAESNPGSSPITPDIPYHVGNPIDVVSGNKYQREIDYRAFNSGLALVRHYNSSLADYDTGFGPGWRHTYQVFLTRPAAGRLNIVQSDGRLIEFVRIDGSGSPEVYKPHDQSDGVLVVAEYSDWHLPDGRKFRFSGSYLVELDFGDHRGSLNLMYRQRRVDTVTNSRGGMIKFVYTSSHSSLPKYGSDDTVQPVGSIEAVVLPSGDLIRYQYGANENLVRTEYPDGNSVVYGYEDAVWFNHLTQRQSTLEQRSSNWTYDENGLAVTWAEGDQRNGLRIDRSFNVSVGYSNAEVVYADGRHEEYQWMESHTEDPAYGMQIDISCRNCPDHNENSDAPSTPVIESAENSIASIRPLSVEPDTNVAVSVWTSLQRTANSTRDQANGKETFEATLFDDQNATHIKIVVDRLGAVSDLQVAETSLRDLSTRMLKGELHPCGQNAISGGLEQITRRRLHAIGRGEVPCSEDPILMLHFAEQIEQIGNSGGPSTGLQHRSTQGVRDWLGRLTAGTLRYCGMPPGKTCEELADDLRMARLSHCAYGRGNCVTQFQLIDPLSIGLNPSRFSDNGFEAQLYFDPVENRHILAFRGTDGVGDDWETNFDQARGEYARQYDLAVNLARELESFPSIQDLQYTGHSLGGGLAAIAGLATQGQASIFNAAAVQPMTATRFGLDYEYNNSNSYINHVHTRSDLLTRMQRWADDLDYTPTSHDANGNTIIHGEIQSVHGRNTEIPNPDIPWVNEQHANASTAIDGVWAVILHSIDAVIHTLDNLVSTNCPQQSSSP